MSKIYMREFWRIQANCKLSDEDARQCGANLLGFFRVLMEWEADNKAANDNRQLSEHAATINDGERPTDDEE